MGTNIEDVILGMCEKWMVRQPRHIESQPERIYFALDGMPVLPFFTELAEALGVPLEAVAVDFEAEVWGGCPTCGPEIEKSVEVTIRTRAI
jgi:hypothetical protein